jgi:hypothetical protein
MKIINKQVIGDVVVTRDTQYNNLLCDNIIIEEDVTARVFGIVGEDITLKKGATIYLHGRFHGKISNLGGILYLFLPNGGVESY